MLLADEVQSKRRVGPCINRFETVGHGMTIARNAKSSCSWEWKSQVKGAGYRIFSLLG